MIKAIAILALAGVLKVAVAVSPEPADPNSVNNYAYSYSDTLTGDVKASESGNGDVAQGQYSIVGPDGSTHTVTYTADDSGFQPIVDGQTPTVV